MPTLTSLEFELKALKTILTPKSDWGAKLFSACKPDFFHSRVGRTIYDRLAALLEAGQAELPSYEFLLQDPKIPENVRAIANEAFRETPVVVNSGDYEYLIKQLSKLAKSRALYEGTAAAANAILGDDDSGTKGESAKEVNLQAITDKLGETILSVDEQDDFISHLQIGRGYNQEAEDSFQRILNGEFSKSMIKTGFQEFDEKTGGHNRTNLVIIGASSGGGKSLYAVNLLTRQYRLGYNVVLVSYEMADDEVFVRLLACISEVDLNKIITNKLNPQEKQRIEVAYREFVLLGAEKGNAYSIICPRGETTVAEIGFRAKSLKPDSLILDYINLLNSPKYESTSQWQQLGQISRESKLLANKLNCVVYLLAQIDETYNLRYSRGIKDHANFVMGWIADDKAMGEGLIKIQQMKARNAPLYPFDLIPRFDIAQFRDPGQEDRTTWPTEEEYWKILNRLGELSLLHQRSEIKKIDDTKKIEKLKNVVEKPEIVNNEEEVKKPKKSKSTWSTKDIVPVDIKELELVANKRSLRDRIKQYKETA